MIKKVIFVGLGGALLVGLFVGHDAISYMRTSYGYMKQAAQESVPVEFQIERARGLIKDLAPEVSKNMHVIAKEEVEVQRLDEQITNTEARLAKEREQILKLKTDLADGKQVYHYASRSYTPSDVKNDLAKSFCAFQNFRGNSCQLERYSRRAGKESASCSSEAGGACWRPSVSCKSKSRISKRVRKWLPPRRPPATFSSTTAGWAMSRN